MTRKQLHILKGVAHWIAIVVSITFTILLFAQLAFSPLGKIATIAFGLTLELFKLYVLTTIKDPKKERFKLFKNIGLFSVYLSLALASGIATLGFAVMEIEGQSFGAESANLVLVQARQDIERITGEINNISQQFQELPPDWITARQRYLTTIETLTERRAELVAIVATSPTLETVSTDVFTLLGNLPFINMDGETLLFYIFLVLVFLLEIVIGITSDFHDKKDNSSIDVLQSNTEDNSSVDELKEEKEDEVGGFFNMAKTGSLPKVKPDKKIAGCESCGMYKLCHSPKIEPVGKGKILVVFQPPTRHEDHSKKPFNEPYQKYLYSVLAGMGITQEQVTLTHSVQCHQGEKVNPKAVEGCHYRLRSTINTLKPKMIIVCDSVSMRTLYHTSNSGRFSFANYNKFTGSIIPDQEMKTIVVPIESPYDAYDNLTFRRKKILERDEKARFASNLWEDSRLKKVDKFRIADRIIKNQIRRGLSTPYYELKSSPVECIYNVETAIETLRYFLGKEVFSFDIETTGLKPYAKGHRIHTWGMSDGERTVAFPHFDDKRFLRVLRQLLTNDSKKIGWNIKYEENWIRHLLGYTVKNWHWDGMIAAHILDNRSGITSLKFQTFSQLGVVGYDGATDQFLKADGSNGINNIHLAPMDDLLKYNGLDALYTYKIFERQFPKINKDQILSEGYELFHEGQIALADMEYNGIAIDLTQVEKNLLQIEKKMMSLEAKVRSAPELKIWDKYDSFNPNSNHDKVHMFYDLMKYPILKRTDKGEPSTDSDTLDEWAELYDNQLAKSISELSTYKKMHDSLKSIKVEATLGANGEWEVHPFFNLNTVSSYRSSSDSPNAQNIPVHNEEAAQMVLGAYKPRKGKVIVGADYTSIESFVGACYHHDQTFEMYLMQEGTDAHADTAEELFLCKKPDIDPEFFKSMRRVGKNVNFSVMYGISLFKLISNTWNSMLSLEQKDFLVTKGIADIKDWGDHLTQWYNDYWTVKYSELGQWRNDLWENYLQTGEVVSYTGFKAVGKLSKNFVGNMPVQSAAFHMLLRGIVEAKKQLTKLGIHAKMILEIHDSVKFECDESEVEAVKGVLQKCFIDMNKERYTWMNMPMRMKGEIYRKNLANEEEPFELEYVVKGEQE